MIGQFGLEKTDRAIWWRQPSGKAKRRAEERVVRGFDGDKGDCAIDMALFFPIRFRAHDHVNFGVARVETKWSRCGGLCLTTENYRRAT